MKIVFFGFFLTAFSLYAQPNVGGNPPSEGGGPPVSGGGSEKTETPHSGAPPSEEVGPKSHTFAANVGIVSDYRSRGVSETMRSPAIQGGFDYKHKSGFYAGVWASNVDGSSNFIPNESIEIDFYSGIEHSLGTPFTFNAGILFYYYPRGEAIGPDFHLTRLNTSEYFLGWTYRILSINFYQAVTNLFGIDSQNPPFNWSLLEFSNPNGSSRGSFYIEANVAIELIKTITFELHGGHQTVLNYSQLSYYDWYVSLTKEFKWIQVYVTYVGTNADPDFFNVPDRTLRGDRHSLGAQGFLFGVYKEF